MALKYEDWAYPCDNIITPQDEWGEDLVLLITGSHKNQNS